MSIIYIDNNMAIYVKKAKRPVSSLYYICSILIISVIAHVSYLGTGTYPHSTYYISCIGVQTSSEIKTKITDEFRRVKSVSAIHRRASYYLSRYAYYYRYYLYHTLRFHQYTNVCL